VSATLDAMRCPDCDGLPAEAAKLVNLPWVPGRFCSCPFDEAHP